jgi:hypothetical protein
MQNTDFIERINVQCMLIGRKYLNEDFQRVVEIIYILIFRYFIQDSCKSIHSEQLS